MAVERTKLDRLLGIYKLTNASWGKLVLDGFAHGTVGLVVGITAAHWLGLGPWGIAVAAGVLLAREVGWQMLYLGNDLHLVDRVKDVSEGAVGGLLGWLISLTF